MADRGPPDPPVAPVEVSLTIAARPSTVFRWFTDPARFARWMGVGSVLEAEPGGRLRVGYPTGQVAAGQVMAVEPDRRIVFTWGYEGDGQAVPAGSSTVEVTLEPDPEGTRVRLRHSGLPAGEPPQAHLAGWRHALATLAYAGSAEQLAPVLGERVADWLAAWNEADPARRAALLGRCLADGGRFRDPTAAVDGAGALADHIGMAQGMGGGARLVGRGDPEPCHGVVRFGWAAVGPGEVVLATGTNVARTDLDGRFRWVTGFWDPPTELPGPPRGP
ncbi:MAG TPA: SRPBCC domain-containing protein [Actinomycetes bacterium]